jgi:hypothetical protein
MKLLQRKENTMEGFTQKDWLDYINKLQDRERNKINNTGLNNWTLFVTLGAIGYIILPN